MSKHNKTAEKAQKKLDQLSKGEKTINQARKDVGLNAINDTNFKTKLTKA